MKRCDDCRYYQEPEYNKPCVVYREDCELYEWKGVKRMSINEAIEELNAIKSEYSNKNLDDKKLMRSEKEALDMAIKALEQEPITEQWQELKETIIELRDNDGIGTQQEVCKFLVNLMDVLEKQMQEPICPSAGVDCEDCPAYDVCGDLVSRQAVLNLFNKSNEYTWEISLLKRKIEKLPPVNTQEPKYCDRNICVSNEYNGIGCDECEVTKSQEPKVGE